MKWIFLSAVYILNSVILTVHLGHYTCIHKWWCTRVRYIYIYENAQRIQAPVYLRASGEQRPLAWRGPAGCQAGRPAAVAFVCSACGGGRTATPELACGQPQRQGGGGRERERSRSSLESAIDSQGFNYQRRGEVSSWNIYSCYGRWGLGGDRWSEKVIRCEIYRPIGEELWPNLE